MSGNLIIPRVEVYWGKVNLTSYNGEGDYPQGEPLVFKVECNLPFQSENPSASMMWAPTAQAYKIYEDLLKNNSDDQIVTTFGYLGTKKVSFVWIWGGNHYTYGNRMELKVELLSELSGLINATVRNLAQAQDQSVNMLTAIKGTEKLFKVEKLNLVQYTDTARKDLQATQVQNHYGKDMVFATAINSIIRENGNYVFSTNIISEAANSPTTTITGRTETASKLVVFTPFQYEGKEDTVIDGQKRKYDEFPNPLKRYGYLLGPSMINEIERSYKWEPPQQLDVPSSIKKTLPGRNQSTAGRRNIPADTQASRTTGSKNGTSKTGGVQHSARNNRHVAFKQDAIGPDKQILIQQEATAKLNLKTFLVPALVGIKPYDILYIPSLNAKTVNDIEDWIVTQVNYSQTDGGVELTVSANRPYGLEGTLMNVKSGTKFLEQAQTLQTLEDWEKYAWCLGQPASTVTENTANSSTPGRSLTPDLENKIKAEEKVIQILPEGPNTTRILNGPNYVSWLNNLGVRSYGFSPTDQLVKLPTPQVVDLYKNYYTKGR